MPIATHKPLPGKAAPCVDGSYPLSALGEGKCDFAYSGSEAFPALTADGCLGSCTQLPATVFPPVCSSCHPLLPLISAQGLLSASILY